MSAAWIAGKPYLIRWVPDMSETCQWITGEPTADDACKCPSEATEGPYCAKHMAMAYTVKPREGKP